MLAQLIERSRADARSQNLRQLCLVERHLCEREIGSQAAENVAEALFYLTGNRIPVSNLRAVETSKTMVAWEADAVDDDDGQATLFDEPRHRPAVMFATTFDGEVVRITSPIFYRKVT